MLAPGAPAGPKPNGPGVHPPTMLDTHPPPASSACTLLENGLKLGPRSLHPKFLKGPPTENVGYPSSPLFLWSLGLHILNTIGLGSPLISPVEGTQSPGNWVTPGVPQGGAEAEGIELASWGFFLVKRGHAGDFLPFHLSLLLSLQPGGVEEHQEGMGGSEQRHHCSHPNILSCQIDSI